MKSLLKSMDISQSLKATKLSAFLLFFAVSLLSTFALFEHQSYKFYQLSRKGYDNVDWTYFQLERTFDGIKMIMDSDRISKEEKIKILSVKWELFTASVETAKGPSFSYLLDYVPKKSTISPAELKDFKESFLFVAKEVDKINNMLESDQGWSPSVLSYLNENYKEYYEAVETISLRANQRASAVSSDKQADLDSLQSGATLAYFSQAIIIVFFTIWGVWQIKEAKKINKSLADVNNALEKSNLELAESKETIMASFKDRNLFIAKSSHELRTPLNAILGFVDLAMDSSEEGSMQKEFLQHAHESAKHLLTLVEDILQYSKVENIAYSYEPLNLLEIVDAAEAMAYTDMEKSKLRLLKDVSTNITVWADAVRLRQIIINLITNASKYAGVGKTLELAAKVKDGFAIITFSDNGSGVPEDFVPLLFTPFTRGVSVDCGIPGSGIGLSTSFKIAQTMGGMLTYQKNSMGGALFELHIPVLSFDSVTAATVKNKNSPTIDGGENSNTSVSPDLEGVIVLGVIKNPDLHEKVGSLFVSTGAQYMLVPDWDYVNDIYANDGFCWVVTDFEEEQINFEHPAHLIHVQNEEDFCNLSRIKKGG